jgi:hypothetical protein
MEEPIKDVKKEIKNKMSKLDRIKKKGKKKLDKLKNNSIDKQITDAKNKMKNVKTMKTKQKYMDQVLKLADDLIVEYDEVKKELVTCKNSVKDVKRKNEKFTSTVLEQLFIDKRSMATLSNKSERSIFFYGELDIGSKRYNPTMNGTIFNTKYLNSL